MAIRGRSSCMYAQAEAVYFWWWAQSHLQGLRLGLPVRMEELNLHLEGIHLPQRRGKFSPGSWHWWWRREYNWSLGVRPDRGLSQLNIVCDLGPWAGLGPTALAGKPATWADTRATSRAKDLTRMLTTTDQYRS